MKSSIRRFALCLGASAALFATTPGSAQAKMVLKLSSYMPTQHFMYVGALLPMVKEIEEGTKGEITFQLFPGGALGKMTEQLDLLRNGLADVAIFIPSYSRGRFPLAEAGTLPFAFKTSAQGTQALNSLNEKWFNPEFKGIQLLFQYATTPAGFLTRGKSVEKVSDLKGLKMRSAGAAATDVLKIAGSNVVTVPLPEIYVALERGVVDGTVLDVVTATTYKIHEVGTHYSNLKFSSVVASIGMNQRTWDKLSKAHQQVVMAAANKAAVRVGELYAERRGKALQIMKDANLKVIEFSSQEQEKFDKLVAPVWDKWVQKLAAEKIDGKAFLADFQAAIKAAADK